MKPGPKSGIKFGVSADGVVAEWERERAMGSEMTARCSRCSWSEAGVARRVLSAQAKHASNCPNGSTKQP